MSVTASVELPPSKQNGDNVEENTKISSLDDPTIPNTPSGKTTNSTPTSSLPSDTPVQNSSEEEHKQSVSPALADPPLTTSAPAETNKPTTRTAVPAVPVVPIVPKTSAKEPIKPPSSNGTSTVLPSSPSSNDSQPSAKAAQVIPEVEPTAVQPAKPAPKLWSNLFQSSTPATTHANGPITSGSGATASGTSSGDSTAIDNGLSGPGSFAKSNTSSLAEALRDYQVSNNHKIAFIEPRGLVNTGNMCYMNSVSSTESSHQDID